MAKTAGALIVALLIGVGLSFGRLLDVYVEWLWFSGLGYGSVFGTALKAKLVSGLAGTTAAFAVLAGNYLFAKRLADPSGAGGDPTPFHPGDATIEKVHKIAPWGLLALSVMAGVTFSGHWHTFLAWINGGAFAEADPLFGRDIGFYVFSYPILRLAQGALLYLLVLGALVALAVYFTNKDFRLAAGVSPRMGPGAQRHLAVVVALMFIAKGWGYWLDRYALLFSPDNVVFGATYSDVYARLPALTILAPLCLLAGAAIIASLFTERLATWRTAVLWGAAVFLFSALGTRLVPDLLQRFRVQPNEIALETPFIERNIRMTRDAYGLSKTEERPFPAELSLTGRDLERNRATTENIRLWDHRPLLDTFGQLQEIRPYYRFAQVDNDRYRTPDGYRQVTLSARELDSSSLASRIWINERLSYTHGYGLVMGPVNEATSEGQPALFIKDIPPVSTPGFEVDRPEIYYGELTHGYAITNTLAKEFDYPRGDENAYADYKGKGGVRLSGFFRRLAFVLKFDSLKILLSSYVTRDSRILFWRGVAERAVHLAPFLALDGDPYLVLADGRLVWILDAYTRTDRYPYASRTGGFNYIRNSVKITVDAYDGAVGFYAVDVDEPILAAYSRAFPGMFRPLSAMPGSLREHLRYPNDLFEAQSHIFARYHMTDPQVFYNQEDLWAVPKEILSGEPTPMRPYYSIMRLPGEKKEEYVLMIPFTPARKDNMIAWAAARSDPPHAGELLVYRFPKEKLVYGPMQIEARVNQDPEISRQFTLWGQRDNKIIRGNLLVIPIEKSVLYVEPVYLQSNMGKIPELKRVIAAYGDNISMEPTLDAALFQAVSASRPEPAKPRGPAARALRALRDARKLQRAGDWAGYGRALEKLEAILSDWSKE